MTTSNYLGLPIAGSFGTFTFEHKLVSALFNRVPISITLSLLDTLDHPDCVTHVDAFISKIEALESPETFTTILDYAVNQINLLAEYQFNEEKLAYEPLVPEDSKQAMWQSSTLELELVYDEENANCFFKLHVEWGRKTVYLLFNSDAKLVGRRPQDTDLSLLQSLKTLGEKTYYYSDEEEAWVSSGFLMLPQWGNLPCRVVLEAALFHDSARENEVVTLLSKFLKMPKADVAKQGQLELERLFNCVWQDYDPEYQRCIPFEVAHNDRALLWNLVACPSLLVITEKEGSLVLISHGQCLLDDEDGIHTVYNENMQLLRMDFGSDFY